MRQQLTISFNINHFVNNDMHSGILTSDISDHFPFFLISKDLMLGSKRRQHA